MRSKEEMLKDLTPEQLDEEQKRVIENMKEFNKEFSPYVAIKNVTYIDDFEQDQLKNIDKDISEEELSEFEKVIKESKRSNNANGLKYGLDEECYNEHKYREYAVCKNCKYKMELSAGKSWCVKQPMKITENMYCCNFTLRL